MRSQRPGSSQPCTRKDRCTSAAAGNPCAAASGPGQTFGPVASCAVTGWRKAEGRRPQAARGRARWAQRRSVARRTGFSPDRGVDAPPIPRAADASTMNTTAQPAAYGPGLAVSDEIEPAPSEGPHRLQGSRRHSRTFETQLPSMDVTASVKSPEPAWESKPEASAPERSLRQVSRGQWRRARRAAKTGSPFA